MLSQTSEYALRAVLYLGRTAPQEQVPADVIADALGAPRNYLAKTLNALAKRGVLVSTRGPRGGFRLAVPPSALTIAEVVHAFDEPRVRAVCLMGGQPCDDRQPCRVHFRWKAVSADMWAPLERTTIADLLDGASVESIIAGAEAGPPRPAAHAAD